MSVGQAGYMANIGSLAPVQTSLFEADRAREPVGAQPRRVYYEQKAEAAADVGELDGEDHETADRDGDGRRPWEETTPRGASPQNDIRQSKDPSCQSGNLLDLTG